MCNDAPTGPFVLEGGLVDAHVHLALDFVGTAFMGFDDGRRALVARNLETNARAGVLGLRDLGSPPGAPDLLDLPRDRLQVASRILGPAGRSYLEICEHVGEEGLVERGRALVAAGVDWVKVMWDFPGPDGNWLASPRNYSPPTIRALADVVHDLGARVAVHNVGPETLPAVEAGVDSIEHGGVLDRETLEAMAERGTAWVPTLYAAHRHLDPLRELGPGPAGIVDRFFDSVARQLQTAAELGVPVLAGSDETPAGELWREIVLLHEHGLSPDQALAAASTVARTFLRLPARPGDAVIYAGDPRRDLARLARPFEVTREGAQLD